MADSANFVQVWGFTGSIATQILSPFMSNDSQQTHQGAQLSGQLCADKNFRADGGHR